ncbi:NfeD family protein [Thermanaerovibrio velox]|uniref:NfeD family protein n=1 Tax=Thermanaerovibrio velox TaxID=108007 RepID=UPI001FDF9232|nr:NfeD family protein [Thermanaerovibrio velox]
MSPWLMDYPLGVWLILLAAVVLVTILSVRALRQKPSFGLEGMEGARAVTLTDLSPSGTVFCHGEIWKARSLSGELPKGVSVMVERVDGLVLLVRPVDEIDEAGAGEGRRGF